MTPYEATLTLVSNQKQVQLLLVYKHMQHSQDIWLGGTSSDRPLRSTGYQSDRLFCSHFVAPYLEAMWGTMKTNKSRNKQKTAYLLERKGRDLYQMSEQEKGQLGISGSGKAGDFFMEIYHLNCQTECPKNISTKTL